MIELVVGKYYKDDSGNKVKYFGISDYDNQMIIVEGGAALCYLEKSDIQGECKEDEEPEEMEIKDLQVGKKYKVNNEVLTFIGISKTYPSQGVFESGDGWLKHFKVKNVECEVKTPPRKLEFEAWLEECPKKEGWTARYAIDKATGKDCSYLYADCPDKDASKWRVTMEEILE